MSDTSAIKIDGVHAPNGPQGQRRLANARALSMRLWDRIEPRSEAGTVRRLGISRIVPKGAEHIPHPGGVHRDRGDPPVGGGARPARVQVT